MSFVPHDQIFAEVKQLYADGGLPRGSPVGWPSVDLLYTVGMGQWSLITGTPGSGKSEWLDAVMVNLAKQGGWHFVIYSPENWPLALHHSKIIEKYIGKPFNPGPTPRLSEDELDEAEEWMHGKFHFAKPDVPNLASILSGASKFRTLTRKTGIVIDPWNHLEHHRPHGLSETEYVSQILSEVIAWVRDEKDGPAHLWLVAHPSKMQKNKEGKLPVPTPHDVSGSAHFWNKADNCITVWRDQSDYSKQEVDIHVQKIRFKHIGHVGLATILYDRVTGRYFERQKADVIDMKNRASGQDL
jgi:twinkle protein